MALAEVVREEFPPETAPEPASRQPGGHAHDDCANCDTPLQGPWCHACGQKGHLHNRLVHLFEELVEGIAHFDGRLWRTLPVLAFNPGRLSREWREGKRVRYVAPLHVFLFSAFVFFLAVGITGGHNTNVQAGPGKPASAAEAMQAQTGSTAGSNTNFERNIRTGVTKLTDEHESKYYQYKIKSLAYKLSFLLAPLSMAVLWVGLLGKRGFTLYDHATVSLYGLGFLGLTGTVFALLPEVVDDLVGVLFIPAMTLHAVVHLKGAYSLGWFGAISRGLFVGLLSSVALLVFVIGVVALGLAH